MTESAMLFIKRVMLWFVALTALFCLFALGPLSAGTRTDKGEVTGAPYDIEQTNTNEIAPVVKAPERGFCDGYMFGYSFSGPCSFRWTVGGDSGDAMMIVTEDMPSNVVPAVRICDVVTVSGGPDIAYISVGGLFGNVRAHLFKRMEKSAAATMVESERWMAQVTIAQAEDRIAVEVRTVEDDTKFQACLIRDMMKARPAKTRPVAPTMGQPNEN